MQGIAMGIVSGLQYIFTDGVQIILNLVNGILSSLPQLLSQANAGCDDIPSGPRFGTADDRAGRNPTGARSDSGNCTEFTINFDGSRFDGSDIAVRIDSDAAADHRIRGSASSRIAVRYCTGTAEHHHGRTSMIQTLVQGIVQSIPLILQAAIQGIIAFVQAIASNAGTIISSGIQIIVALVSGIIQAIPQIIVAVCRFRRQS